jgi:sugar (pentulose or hexulose) kinase
VVRTVAVVDIGKTNAKLALVEAATGAELALRTTANEVRSDGPYPHFGVPRLWDFICGALSEIGREHEVDAVVVTTHGAAGALISESAGADGLALPVLDYEFAGPDEFAAEYDAVRPDFAETLSPRMPAGLNLGAQIFWQQKRFPDAFRGARYVTYQQYWSWRLSGVAATEWTALGSHTDLWNPVAKTWSSLVDRLGWRRLLAPVRRASEKFGPLRPELAGRLGLAAATQVLCGIHDSNASLLPHLMTREAPFAVVSTGTWVIVLAVGGSTERLDPRRDGLAYVNAFGDPVPAARFMGGREFQRLVGSAPPESLPGELDRVLSEEAMVLPSFAPGVGPFPHREGRWTAPADALSPGERAAAASLYLTLVTAECLAIAGADGPIIVEGPFAANKVFCAALSAVRGEAVFASGERTGTMRGAALLAAGTAAASLAAADAVPPLTHPALADYVRAWRMAAAAG